MTRAACPLIPYGVYFSKLILSSKFPKILVTKQVNSVWVQKR